MKRRTHVAASYILFLFLGFAFESAFAQHTAASSVPQDSGVTLRARARLVLVDVTVTDRNHVPIHDLKQSDFTLFEDKAQQTILHFEEHRQLTPEQLARAAAFPRLPPGIFTNFVPTPENQAVNVLLLDSLNTPMRDQAYVRSQMLDYVKQQKPGTSMAIFGLSSRLSMLQGFTSNPDVLRDVMTHHLQRASPLLDDAVGGGGMPESTADQIGDMGVVLPSSVVAGLNTFDNIQSSAQSQLRAKLTLDSMNVLARYLASLPGRKNLIWFSGSFPINIMPDTTGNSSDPFAGVASSEAEYRETTNLLARAQVAVYPVDARGIMASPVFDASQSGQRYARQPSKIAEDESRFFESQADEHSTMQRMADDTGGQAFYNTNGLRQAVAKIVDNGSNYYTLAYTPTSSKWKGDFRRIDVKLAQSGVHLAFRRGYYADDEHAADTVLTPESLTPAEIAALHDPAPMRRAMEHGMPGPTEIIFKARVLPYTSSAEPNVAPDNHINLTKAKGPYRRYMVDLAADGRVLAMPAAEDHLHHGKVEVVVLVYQPDGTLINEISKTLVASLTEQTYRTMLRTGLAAHVDISVPDKGEYALRIGVHDLVSNRVGATEVPVAAVKNLPPPPAPAPSPASPAAPAAGAPAHP